MSVIPGKEKYVERCNPHDVVVITKLNDDDVTGTYFFSKDHCQHFHSDVPLDDKWVPITEYNITIDRVRRKYEKWGFEEIPNPDPDFQPEE